MPSLKIRVWLGSLLMIVGGLALHSCANEKFDLPVIPAEDERFPSIDDADYVLLNPPLDANNGYDFNNPSDVYIGVDNLLYVCDTGNNRIVMMDLGGQIQGVSQPIDHPEAITQNDSLQLLIVNKTNTVYRIKLFENNHDIASAPIEPVFQQASEPTREFTGITVHNGFEYYVTVVDVADSSTNFREFSFIYDFNADHTFKGPLPLQVNGSGLFSAILPTGIVSLRELWLDLSSQEVTPAFLFCQTGQTQSLINNFKVQHVTTRVIEGNTVIVPDTSLISTEIYLSEKYGNPEDITIDRSGFVFVVDEGSGDDEQPPAFYRFSLNSGRQIQAYLGNGDNTDALTFSNPRGIAVLPSLEEQVVYIADSGNNRILRFQLSTEL